MINQKLNERLNIIKTIFPKQNLEYQVDICNFLKEQDWNENNEMSNAFLIISEIILRNEKVKFIFEDKIESSPHRCSFKVSREQISDLNAVGVNTSDMLIKGIIDNIVGDIISDLNDKNSSGIIVTNKKFISKIYTNQDPTGQIVLDIYSNFKVMTIRDLRKIKLEKLKNNYITGI